MDERIKKVSKKIVGYWDSDPVQMSNQGGGNYTNQQGDWQCGWQQVILQKLDLV
jgi:hypothetical protein